MLLQFNVYNNLKEVIVLHFHLMNYYESQLKNSHVNVYVHAKWIFVNLNIDNPVINY